MSEHETTEGAARRRGLRAWAGAALFAATVVAAAGAGVATLYARAEADAVSAGAPPPLPVRVATLRMQDGYAITARHVGRVEPARETRVGFERAGLVTAVLVQEGDRVRAGDPMARLDARALDVARRRLEAARAAAEAELGLARSTLERRRALTDQGHASQQALDEARFSVDAQTARLDEIAAQLAQVALDLEKSAILAPFDGVVAARMADEGAVVEAGAPLARLQEVGRPRARIGLPVRAAQGMASGETYQLETPSGPVAARLASISPDIDPATRTVAALFDLDPGAPVAMGEIVRLVLPGHAEGRGAWVPLTALQEGMRGMWALTVVADGTDGPVARRVAAQALHVADGRAFVAGPFADGDRVIVEGVDRVAPGQRVAPAAGGGA